LTVLQTYCRELQAEFENILQYWMLHTIDNEQGGFYGSLDNNNTVQAAAPKGVVLNARILWTFSAAFNFTQHTKYLVVAQRAYQYLCAHFTDREYGGMYWCVNAEGYPLNDRKQVYGMAFYLYGLSEYYEVVKEPAVLEEAIQLFRLIEEKSFDNKRKGYYEAFARDWQSLPDMRLSDKDANEKKTMNTHLHVVEAYANLYKQWPDQLLRERIVQLLAVFDEHMIDKNKGHLLLFFDDDWRLKPDVVSYGHDIEAAWLLQQCAEIIQDDEWMNKMKKHALGITDAAMEGLDTDGALWYEYDPATHHLVKEKHWWPQAEAMLGFFNAWQLGGKEIYLQASLKSWNFIKQYICDKENGEWLWGVYADYSVMSDKDKAGFWKCPYHNSRACMEMVKRLQQYDYA
jgi:mannobiose 2-epimerase